MTFERIYVVVRVEGLEPPRRKTPDPKSGASANSATRAYKIVLDSFSLSR